jgi:hypothetical protein
LKAERDAAALEKKWKDLQSAHKSAVQHEIAVLNEEPAAATKPVEKSFSTVLIGG